jgi:glycosyltransferase involved in cell wall biosynthesis
MSSRPHVAFVLPGLSSGGSEHIVSLLCNHMSRAGWAVSLFAFDDPAVPPYYAHDPAVRVAQLGHSAGKRSALKALWAVRGRIASLRREFRAARPDLVVSFLARTNVVSVVAARSLGIPVLVSERNNPEQQRPGPIWSALRRYAYARAHGLITMTAGAMSHFPAVMRRRQWVIRNPTYAPVQVDPERACRNRIVAVGRLVPQKGFDLLLDAFAGVAHRVPDWSLVIWGEGPERARLEAQRTALGLEARVAMPGVTKGHGEWLHDADIFVLSSRFEGWGIVVGEAMAAGVPTISFDCRWGPSEMITHGESGLLVPDGDVAGLGEAIAELCADAARRRQLAQGAVQASLRFEPAAILKLWEEVLVQALPVASRAAPEITATAAGVTMRA